MSKYYMMAEGEGRGSNLTEEDHKRGGQNSHDNQHTSGNQ